MNLEKYLPTAAPAAPATWAQVRYWADIAGKFQHASLAAQVMAGFALAELRHQNRIQPGKPKKILPHDAVISGQPPEPVCPGVRPGQAAAENKPSWPELVQKNAGVSDDTARRWILMADGIKTRWKKLEPQDRLRQLMLVPVSDWTGTDTQLVNDALYKVTDGSTQLEFMRELGLARQKSGGPGRAPGCDGAKPALTLAETAALRQTQARVNWFDLQKLLAAYREKFLTLSDDEVTAQIADLEAALNPRKAWLKHPINRRDPALIAEMFQ
jgi:hypothetical protein